MDDKQAYELAKQLSEYCLGKETCDGCRFSELSLDDEGECVLHRPYAWELFFVEQKGD